MNNTEEIRIAYRLKGHLNRSATTLPAGVDERLRAARERAMAHQRKGVAQVALAGGGGVGFGWLGQLAPLLVLVAGLAGINFWHQSQLADEIADIDSQMLVDELPPNAYLDKGFGTWLDRSAN
jgi:hypothetical protein